MRLNVDRLCELAGISQGNGSLLSEAGNLSYHEDESLKKEREVQFGNQLNEADDEEDDDEEDVNESEEIRNLQEAHLKATIKKEIQNILREMEGSDEDLSGRWIYGKNQPRATRKGLVATAFPGIGFRN